MRRAGLAALIGLVVVGCGRTEDAPDAEAADQVGAMSSDVAPANAPGAGMASEQVQAGARAFSGSCAGCHSVRQAVELVFTRAEGRALGGYADQVRAMMPPENPGSLPEQEYLDILAMVLAEGGADVGVARLDASTDDWREIVFTAPDGWDAVPAAPGASLAWTAYRGDLRMQGYSAADQITPENVDQLQIAWAWTVRNFGPTPETRNITTPLMIDGVLYFTAGPTRNVIAVDPGTGETLWMYRPQEDPARFDEAPRKGSGRGLGFWRAPDGTSRVLTVTPGFHLVSLDAATGRPDPNFGQDGVVDMMIGVRNAVEGEIPDIGNSSPPLVIGDVVVVGPAHDVGIYAPSSRNDKGDVRAYRADTGELAWTFRTVPELGSPGSETWTAEGLARTGNVGVWAPISADPERGLVYLPTEAPTNDIYGGARPGDNFYSSSIVCLDATTGELVWAQQLVHHDIWDFDTPAAPILVDVEIDGETVPIVAQVTKQSFVYVYNRETGEPIWPIEERPVPASNAPGETAAATQPFPTRPAPFDLQGLTVDDLIDFTPELRAEALEAIEGFELAELYTPYTVVGEGDAPRGVLAAPHLTGGANWEGGVVDPETGILYVASKTETTVRGLQPARPGSDAGYNLASGSGGPDVQGLPLVRPPYGRITAIDLNTGEHVFMIANADTPSEIADHPALEGLDIPRTGRASRSGLLVTRTLLFSGEGEGGRPVLRAHDKATGEILAEIALPGAQTGMPMTYVWNGRQYVVVAVGDGENAAEIVALALP
jgi:quinoprotein glucose dehydrogenase